MSLKFRLAFLYSLSVFIILLVSAFSIFLFNENFRREEFIKRLLLEASESLQLFTTAGSPTKILIDDLNQNASNFAHEVEINIFDSAYHLLYSSPQSSSPSISPNLFQTAKKKHDYVFERQGKETVLLYRVVNGRPLFVYESAFDKYGTRKSDNLKVLLTASVAGGLLLAAFLSFFYVRHAMSPLEELKSQIEKINEKNLKERIQVGNRNNEVWQIAKKFNEMLDRLEQAFEQRKNFVQLASHELRTPLANMLSQTESALGKSMSAGELQSVLVSLKEDQQDLIDLTNSLLTLSRYEKITALSDVSIIRIDEVLYEAVDFARHTWTSATVTVDFESVPENEDELKLQGNESLIKSALQNLLKNGIQYSTDNRVKVSIASGQHEITLQFENHGKQLSPDEQSRLFIPFFRGENSVSKKGYGLGLSIVQRIVHVHQGTVSYQPAGNNINQFIVHLPVYGKTKNPAGYSRIE